MNIPCLWPSMMLSVTLFFGGVVNGLCDPEAARASSHGDAGVRQLGKARLARLYRAEDPDYSAYVPYLDAEGNFKPINQLLLKRSGYNALAFTLDAEDFSAPNAQYDVAERNDLRTNIADKACWLAKEHWGLGQKILPTIGGTKEKAHWRELTAVQAAIWSLNDAGLLTPSRLPDDGVRARAEYLSQQADERGGDDGDCTPSHQSVLLDKPAVVSQTGRTVTVEIRLHDEMDHLIQGKVYFSYDHSGHWYTTDGSLQFERPRHDREVSVKAKYKGADESGSLWAPINETDHHVVAAEHLWFEIEQSDPIHPTELSTNLSLLYLMVADWLTDRGWFGRQTAENVALGFLASGWLVVIFKPVWRRLRASSRSSASVK
jgi:hypothetical protein